MEQEQDRAMLHAGSRVERITDGSLEGQRISSYLTHIFFITEQSHYSSLVSVCANWKKASLSQDT